MLFAHLPALVPGFRPARLAGLVLATVAFFAARETFTTTSFGADVPGQAADPRNKPSDDKLNSTTVTPPLRAIHDIQGTGMASPLLGQAVTVHGVVTASFQNTSTGLGGFFVQAPKREYDHDANTSEGIFVFDAGSTGSIPVAAGDLVSVTGTVAEFGTAPDTLTELASVTSVTKIGTAPLPAPVKLTLPMHSATDFEKYEGMRVVLPQTLTVTSNFQLGHFGEITLSKGRLPTPTNIVAPGAPAVAQENANLLNQILVDDESSKAYPDPTPFLINSGHQGLTLRGGATVTGMTGVLTYAFGNYLVEPTVAPVFVDTNPRTPTAPNPGGSLRVAIGNVDNDFNGDGAGGGFPTPRGATTLAEFQRQRTKIIAGILGLAPDIMGLTEVENDGFGPTSTIQDIVTGLNAGAASGVTYAFVDASKVDNGTDLIRVALIYRKETVETVGSPAALSNQYFANIARTPLAQTFRQKANGEKLTVCINHFRAKGAAATSAASTDGLSPNPNLDIGDGQGTNNYVRKREAQTLTAWLATDPTSSGDPDFLIIGDLNSYAKEDPVVAIESAGYISLTERTEGVNGYSYAFKNEYGHLDHALASPTLNAQAVGAMSWHVNSDEPPYYDYNLENKSAAQQAINVGTPYRYSDHDPVVIGLNLGGKPRKP